MSGSVKKIATAFLLLVLVAVGYQHVSELDSNARRDVASSFNGEKIASDNLVFSPKMGEVYQYQFSRTISFKGLSNSIPDIEYHGLLSFDVYRVDDDSFDAIASNSISGLAANDFVSLRIHMKRNGSGIAVFGEKIRTDKARDQLNILKDLIASWAFPIQEDTVGGYSASFFSLPTQGEFPKRGKAKKTYLASKVAPDILESENTLLWDLAMGLPHSIQGKERLRLSKSEKAIVTDSRYEITFEQERKSSGMDAKLLALLQVPENLALSIDANSHGNPALDVITWAKVEDELRKIQSLPKMEQLRAFGDLVHLLRNQGDILPQVLAMVDSEALSQGAASKLFGTIVGALASVATPAMQSALVGIYQDPSASVSAKGGVLTALTTTQAPIDDETRSFLSSTMQSETNPDLAQAAGFALGASLQNASSPVVDQSIATIQAEWNALQANPNLSAEIALLDTMGNSGRSEFFPDLSSVINSSADPLARAKAVFGLRYFTGSAAISLLSSSLASGDAQVRTAAVQAMQVATWNEAFRAPLQNCSASEPLSSLQSACTSVLTQAATKVTSL